MSDLELKLFLFDQSLQIINTAREMISSGLKLNKPVSSVVSKKNKQASASTELTEKLSAFVDGFSKIFERLSDPFTDKSATISDVDQLVLCLYFERSLEFMKLFLYVAKARLQIEEGLLSVEELTKKVIRLSEIDSFGGVLGQFKAASDRGNKLIN